MCYSEFRKRTSSSLPIQANVGEEKVWASSSTSRDTDGGVPWRL